MTTSVLQSQLTDLSQSKVVACLPYQILHMAAHFSSKDDAKQILTVIHVKKEGSTIRIASTDGHRLFRFEIKEGNKKPFYVETSQDDLTEFFINPKAFKKSLSKAADVLIYENGFAQVFSMRDERLEGIFWKSNVEGTFPNIDQLIPDSFANEPKASIGFNAAYLNDFFKLAYKFSENGVVRMNTNTPTTPIVFRAKSNIKNLEGSLIEYLLMPVQIRADW